MATHARTPALRGRPEIFTVSRRRKQAELFARPVPLAETPMQEGPPASVSWCQAHVAHCRGALETTALPVGIGIDALRFGLKSYRLTTSRGLRVRRPIAYIITKARMVQRGEVKLQVPVADTITWH